jgi:hypothetical protein
LAALRFHQDENLRCSSGIPDQAIKDIASSCGSLKPLNFDEVSRLCERVNIGDEAYAGPHKEVWVLIVMDKSTVVHAHAYNSEFRAQKAMLECLRNHQGYDGRDNVAEARDWVAGHGGDLRVEICSVKVDCSASLKKRTDMRCNWCGKEITGEPIKWKGVCFCGDVCLDECRAAQ